MIPGANKIPDINQERLITLIVVVLIFAVVSITDTQNYWILNVVISVGFTASFIYLMTLKNYRAYLFVAAVLFYALASILELYYKEPRSSSAHPFYLIGHLLMVCSSIRYMIYNWLNS